MAIDKRKQHAKQAKAADCSLLQVTLWLEHFEKMCCRKLRLKVCYYGWLRSLKGGFARTAQGVVHACKQERSIVQRHRQAEDGW